MGRTTIAADQVRDELANIDIAADAGISGSKITPNFAAQDVYTTGNVGAGVAPTVKLDVNGPMQLRGATSGYVRLSAPAIAGSQSYTFPADYGTSGYQLTTNGAGTLTWTIGSVVTYPLQASPLGSNTACAYSFLNDANTGMYAATTGVLSFATAGTERIKIGATGLVGIGKTAATALDVNGTVTATAFSGPLTGSVTGNCSGSSGSCTGNSANVTGTIAIANGGTGQTTAANAITALTGAQTAGKYLRSDGTNAALATISAGDVPTLNQNTTGSSASCTGNAANVTGTVAIGNGGTGQTSQAAAITALTGAQTTGYYLRSNGTNAVLASISAGDVPTLNQNTTGSAGSVSGSQTGITTVGTLSSLIVSGSLQAGNAVAATNVQIDIAGVASKAGRLAFKESGVDKWFIGNGAANETGNFEIYNASGSMPIMILKSNSYVGILKTPTTALDVNGTVTATTFAGALTGNVTGNCSGTSGSTIGSSASCTGNAANVTGTVAIANGGTGQTTAAAAITALTGTQVSGQYLRSNGSNAVLTAISAGDIPTLNQNTTGYSASCTGNALTSSSCTGNALTATSVSGSQTGITAVGTLTNVTTSGSVFLGVLSVDPVSPTAGQIWFNNAVGEKQFKGYNGTAVVILG